MHNRPLQRDSKSAGAWPVSAKPASLGAEQRYDELEDNFESCSVNEFATKRFPCSFQ